MAKTSHTSAKSPARRRGRRRRLLDASPGGSFDGMGILISLPGNKKIFTKGEPSEYFYKVESGCIRTYSDLDGDRRRIYAFYFPGDHFGLEACEEHGISAETVTSSSVRRIEKKATMSRAARDVVGVNFLLHIATTELQRSRNHNLLLRKGAHERLVEFFREIQKRNQSQSEVDLPMPRSDMADYLGLTVETVSRALTRLKNTSTISMLTHRRVSLRDPIVLN